MTVAKRAAILKFSSGGGYPGIYTLSDERMLLTRGVGNGERGTGNGERGTGNGERGIGNGNLKMGK